MVMSMSPRLSWISCSGFRILYGEAKKTKVIGVIWEIREISLYIFCLLPGFSGK